MTDGTILAMILGREGGYVDDPVDRGRCTNYGITIGTLREWRGRPVTCDDVRQLTASEACDIYRERYLKPFDGLDPEVKPQVVDIAVNCGVVAARGMLALAQQNTRQPLNTALAIQRLRHYVRIVKHDTSQVKFLNGWLNRAVEFL